MTIFNKDFPDKLKSLNKKKAYPFEYFNNFDDYQKPLNDLKKKNYFNELKYKLPNIDEIERTIKFSRRFNIKNEEELTKFYLKSYVIPLADVFEKLIKVSIKEYFFNPLFCVSLLGYTWQYGLNYTVIILETFKIKA